MVGPARRRFPSAAHTVIYRFLLRNKETFGDLGWLFYPAQQKQTAFPVAGSQTRARVLPTAADLRAPGRGQSEASICQ